MNDEKWNKIKKALFKSEPVGRAETEIPLGDEDITPAKLRLKARMGIEKEKAEKEKQIEERLEKYKKTYKAYMNSIADTGHPGQYHTPILLSAAGGSNLPMVNVGSVVEPATNAMSRFALKYNLSKNNAYDMYGGQMNPGYESSQYKLEKEALKRFEKWIYAKGFDTTLEDLPGSSHLKVSWNEGDA